MKFSRERFGWLVMAALVICLPLTGCGSGGSTTPTATNNNSSGETISSLTSGYQVPSEISAVPESSTDSTTPAGVSIISRAIATPGATTDYEKAIPAKYVEEPVLDQFEIIEEVLSALNQTRYYDSVNINKGPYKAMIAWQEEDQGREIKTLESWIVDSQMILVDGKDINRVYCWIEEEGELVKAEFKVYEPAVFDADGEVTSYGKWELNVKFDETGENFFVATAEPNGSGGVLIKINEHEDHGGGDIWTLKGILNRSNTQGYGKVEYADWDSCDSDECIPKMARAQYAYNDGYLGLKKISDIGIGGAAMEELPIYKDRSKKVEITHQYGLFYNENPVTTVDSKGNVVAPGDDVRKHKRFGFPVIYTDSTGNAIHAYYGAWQGRHELWAGEASNSILAGDTVTTETWGDTEPVTYTVADTINGSFTKRTLVAATLDDIKGVPVETWIDKHFDLMYGDLNNISFEAWYFCKGEIDWSGYYPGDPMSTPIPPTCRDFGGNQIDFTPFSAYNELVVDSQDNRKWVNISGQGTDGSNVEYVFLNDEVGANYQPTYTGPGFYQAQRGINSDQLTPTGDSVYIPAPGDSLWVSIGGSIYIAYTDTGWVQKKLLSFDNRNWQPTFDDSAPDKPFSPQIGREYYMNANGVNYVVRRVKETGINEDDYEVRLEIQTTANPRNCNTTNTCSDIVPSAADYFRTPWDQSVRLELVTDPSSSDYLLLKYNAVDTDSTNNANSGATVGQVVGTGMWGLQAWSNGTDGIAGSTEAGPDEAVGTTDDWTSDDYPLDNSGGKVTVDEWGNPDSTSNTRPVEFNWEFCDPTSGQNQCWGAQTYLKDASGYVILDDPIMLDPITVQNAVGTTKTLQPQYDGWLHGMPDIHETLRNNNWQITQDIKDKVINIPAGKMVTDGNENYYLKPLETSVFLETVVDPLTIPVDSIPDVSQADNINLDTLPTFTEHNMGAMPTVTKVKFSEGILVE